LYDQAVAFGKLQGILDSKPLNLPGKNAINLGLLAGVLATGGLFLTSSDPSFGVTMLGATALLGGVLGAHLTASIGECCLGDEGVVFGIRIGWYGLSSRCNCVSIRLGVETSIYECDKGKILFIVTTMGVLLRQSSLQVHTYERSITFNSLTLNALTAPWQSFIA
jgi:hypothetical protein